MCISVFSDVKTWYNLSFSFLWLFGCHLTVKKIETEVHLNENYVHAIILCNCSTEYLIHAWQQPLLRLQDWYAVFNLVFYSVQDYIFSQGIREWYKKDVRLSRLEIHARRKQRRAKLAQKMNQHVRDRLLEISAFYPYISFNRISKKLRKFISIYVKYRLPRIKLPRKKAKNQRSKRQVNTSVPPRRSSRLAKPVFEIEKEKEKPTVTCGTLDLCIYSLSPIA